VRPLRTVVLVTLAVSSTVGVAPAHAAPGEGDGARASAVAVLRPAGDDPVLVAAAARTQLELGATGVRSALIDAGDGYAARVAFVREDGVATIDVLGTPASGVPIHRRVPVPSDAGGDDAAVLAVRAVEVLRGIQLELHRPRMQAPLTTTTTTTAATHAPAPVPSTATWRFEVGLGALTARPFGAALGVGPVAAAAGAIAPHVSIAAAFAGPFFTARPETPDGTADTREELGAIGLRIDTRAARLEGHVTGAVGLHHSTVRYDPRGSGAMGGADRVLHVVANQSLWNPLVTLAAGASWRVSGRWGVSLQCAALLVAPELDLLVNDHHVGTLGGPSLLTTLSAWVGI
jgi:hypothetical protein